MTEPVRILVVDDELPQMQAICDTLRDHDYATTGFATAPEALAAIAPGRFDLLLTDLTMPGMDGISLIKAALERDPDLVCIVMTGAGTIASAVGSMKAGAFDYLLKPFRMNEILPVLARALAVRRLRLENAQLQERVRERTAELEAANSELEAFSYSVSHDLRAPLRVVSSFAGMLKEEHGPHLDADAQRLIERITVNAHRMDQLIVDLLHFSRLGRQPLARLPVDVAALVAEAVEEQRGAHPDRTVEVRIGDLPACIGDRALLAQVFTNLLSNAFKYTARRERALIEVGCRTEGGFHTYQVRDNGVGYDPRYAQKLFGVFSRLHGAEEFPGTGIGLSIVRRIVERHGGRIRAEAEEGVGATFFVTLPASEGGH